MYEGKDITSCDVKHNSSETIGVWVSAGTFETDHIDTCLEASRLMIAVMGRLDSCKTALGFNYDHLSVSGISIV